MDCDYTKLSTYQALKPLMISLKIIGLHYTRDSSSSRKWSWTFQAIHSWMILIFTWVIVAINSTALRYIKSIDPTLFGSLITLIAFTQYALNVTCFVKASHSQRALKALFISFSDLEKCGGLLTTSTWQRKVATIACIICWFLVILTTTFLIYIVFATTVVDNLHVDNKAQDTIMLKILFMFFEFYYVAMWIFSDCFQLVLCFTLHQEFNLFYVAFKSKFDAYFHFKGSLEIQRRRYLKMMKIVKALDNTFSLRQLGSFGGNLICICFLLYIMIYFPAFVKNIENMSFCLFWLFVCVLELIIVCVSGIILRSGVSSFGKKMFIAILYFLIILF